jgi:SAM-dependent methyltransferase
MHDTLKRLHARQRGKGTAIDGFRLNEVVSQIAFGGRRGRVYQQIVSLAGVRPGDSVLDVGSSSGYLARKLAAATGPAGHVTGVDPSEAAIACARRHALPTVTFTVGTAQDLDLPDAAFDIVTCTLAIHHIPARKRQAAFREMYRVTKPGGRLLAAGLRPIPAAPAAASRRAADAPRRGHGRLAGATGRHRRVSGRVHRPAAPAALRPGHPPRTRNTAIANCGSRQAPDAAQSHFRAERAMAARTGGHFAGSYASFAGKVGGVSWDQTLVPRNKINK